MTADRRFPLDGAAQDGDPRLLDTIAALRDEVAGLRDAGQLRAIIEQAKGVLMERHRITSEEAFSQLRELSQQHNVRLVEVAATVVGVAVPTLGLSLERVDDVIRSHLPSSVATSPAWRELQQQPEVKVGVASALLDVVASGAEHGDDAAELLMALLEPFGVDAVVVYGRLADESLSLIGSSGIPVDFVSSWSRIPPAPAFPYVAAVRDGHAYFWETAEERAAQFPAAGQLQSPFQASVVIPVMEGDEPVGVAGLLWAAPRPLPAELRESLTGLIQRVSRMMLRAVAPVDPALRWLGVILNLHLDPWILLDVISSADGRVRDFVVVDAAQNAPDARAAIGERMLSAWPVLATDGTLEALTGLATTGGMWTITQAVTSEAPWATAGTRLRAARLGHRLVMLWRPGSGLT